MSRAFTVVLCDSAPYRLLSTNLCQSARLSLSQEKKPDTFGTTKVFSRLPLRGSFPGITKALTKSGRMSQTKQDNISGTPLRSSSSGKAHLREQNSLRAPGEPRSPRSAPALQTRHRAAGAGRCSCPPQCASLPLSSPLLLLLQPALYPQASSEPGSSAVIGLHDIICALTCCSSTQLRSRALLRGKYICEKGKITLFKCQDPFSLPAAQLKQIPCLYTSSMCASSALSLRTGQIRAVLQVWQASFSLTASLE